MHSKQGSLSWLRQVMSVALIIAMVLLPAEIAIAQSPVLDVPGRQFSDVAQDITQSIAGQLSPEDIIGEDIIINVDQYQPTPIPSTLIEDQGATIIALLEGRPTNPTIEISKIDRVISQPVKITTIPPDKPVSVGAIRHVPPQGNDLSYENLGYIAIPIRRIPKEADVPDQIDIEMLSRIYFDVSSGLGFGPRDDVLTAQDYSQWLPEKDKHAFHAGYIRTDDIGTDQATFTLYDRNVNEITTITVKERSASSVINTYRPGTASAGRLFDQVRIRVNEIRGRGDKAMLYVTREGTTTLRVVSKGQYIAPGSQWYVSEIKFSADAPSTREVTLKNSKNQPFFLSIIGSKRDQQTIQGKVTGTSPESEEMRTLREKLADINKKIAECDTPKELEARLEDCYGGTVMQLQGIVDNKDKQLPQSITRDIKVMLHRTEVSLVAYHGALAAQNKEVTKVQEYLAGVRQLLSRVSPEEIPQFKKPDARQSLQLAKQSYQQLIDEYPKDRLYRAKALFRLGMMHWQQEQNIPLALNTFELLLAEYSEQELAGLRDIASAADIRSYITLLKGAKEGLIYTNGIKELPEPDGTITTVTLIDVEDLTSDREASARIKIGNIEAPYKEGDLLPVGGKVNWKVHAIKPGAVELSYITSRGNTRYFTLKEGNIHYPELTEEGAQQDNKVPVQLVSTNLQREVHISIEPAAERAYSEARYTLHLPIEKRPFGLPLFSDTIDQEIAKTDRLLIKLDNIISQVTAVQQAWTKICYTTYLTLWAKNLLSGAFGGKTVVARNKVNEMYKERYKNGQLEGCTGLTFEQCIREKYRSQYESDINNMGGILDDIGDGRHKTQAFTALGREYENDRKDMYVLERMKALHPDDPIINKEYYTSLQNLQLRQLEKEAVQSFYDGKKFRDYPAVQSQAEGIIDSTPELKEMRSTKNDNQIYDEYKETIFRNYKEQHVHNGMKGFYGQLLTQKKTPTNQQVLTRDLSIVTGLNSTFFRPRVATVELAKDRVRSINGKNVVYLDYQEHILEAYSADTGEAKIGDITYKFVDKPKEQLHKRTATLIESGRAKDKVEFLSADAFHYLRVEYSATGNIENVNVYKRADPNTAMGSESDVRLAPYADALAMAQRTDPALYNKLQSAHSCVSTINKKRSSTLFGRGDKNVAECANLGAYSIGAAVQAVGPSCIDYMSLSECRILYNACDPVICPASRCNFGGEWQVDNVVQTGIVGSTVLCFPNWGEVVMPLCITGILAGLQNIKSIIAGYKECLVAAKVEGRSIGICDEIRSVNICEILWKEGIAIFNVKEGLLGAIAKKIFGMNEDDGEYAAFQQSFDNSINTMKFFTQEYAKNVFAQYNGGALPELGATICKSAIYGKAPGIGSFFDQITRPESPPQFTAFFDETPTTDITRNPVSIYNVFYHIYAGENQGIYFTIYLQARDLEGRQIMPPHVVVRNRQLPQGEFAPESLTFQAISGYQEICVEVNSPGLPRQPPVCGFGKASTSYFLNKVNDNFVQSEVLKRINSEEECTPSPGRLTTFSSTGEGYTGSLPNYPAQDFPGSAAIGVGVGSVSTGFLSTGIVRKCSLFNPGIGARIDDWTAVGTCGKDDRRADLGTCWLYRPALNNLIKSESDRQEVGEDLDQRAKKIIKEQDIPGMVILEDNTVESMMAEAESLRTKGKAGKVRDHHDNAILIYDKILSSVYLDEAKAIQALFEKAQAYFEMYLLLSPQITPPPPEPKSTDAQQPQEKPQQFEKDSCVIRAKFYADFERKQQLTTIKRQELPAEIFMALEKEGDTTGCTDTNLVELQYGKQQWQEWSQNEARINKDFTQRVLVVGGSRANLQSFEGKVELWLKDSSGQKKYGYPLGEFEVTS